MADIIIGPGDVRQVGITRDPGVRATPEDFGAQIGDAMSGMGSQLAGIATALEGRRREAVDGVYAERHAMELELATEELFQSEANGDNLLNPDSWQAFDRRVADRSTELTQSLEAEGYRPSQTARRNAERNTMRIRGQYGRQFITASNNQIVTRLVSDTEKTIGDVAGAYLRNGDLDGAVRRSTEIIRASSASLTPDKTRALFQVSNDNLLNAWTQRNQNETERLEAAVVSGALDYEAAIAELDKVFSEGDRFEQDPVKLQQLRSLQRRRIYDAEATGLLNLGLIDEAERFIEQTYGGVPRPTTEALGRYSEPDLVGAMQQVESSGNPYAVSPAGALGIMQVMPDTAREIAAELGDTAFPTTGDADIAKYLSDEEVNARYGVHYLRKMLARYDGDREAALIAYNGGPQRADAWIRAGRDYSVVAAETRDYVPKVLAALEAGNYAAAGTMPEGEVARFRSGQGTVTADTFNSTRYTWQDFRNDRFSGASMDAAVVGALDAVTDQFGHGKLTITSGYRSPDYNASASFTGKEGQHTHGTAIDIDVSGYSDEEKARLVSLFVASGATGIGHYSNGTIHIDFRQGQGKGPGGLALWYNQNQPYTSGEQWFDSGIQAGLGQRPLGGGPALDPSLTKSQLWQEQIDARRRGLLAEDEARRRAEQERLAIEQFDLRERIADDVSQITHTGQGRDDLTVERVQQVLGADDTRRWLRDRQQGASEYVAMSGLLDMTGEQMDAHIDRLEPTPGQPNYDAAVALQGRVSAEADRIRGLRSTDPALSVTELPEVRQAGEAFDKEDSASSWQRLIGARLSAQTRIGLPEALHLPITKDEARLFSAPIRTATQEEWFDRFDEMSAGITREFGPYADEIIRQITTEFVRDADKAIYASSIIGNLIAGQMPDPGDIRAVDELTETERIDRAASQLSGVPQDPHAGPVPWSPERRSPPTISPEAMDSVLDQLSDGVAGPQLSRPEPTNEAIEYLRDNPGTIGEFMEIYGNAPIPMRAEQPPGPQSALDDVGPQEPVSSEEFTALLASGTLKRGSEGPAVADVQRFLESRGYSVGEAGIDEKWGGDTQKAFEAFAFDAALREMEGRNPPVARAPGEAPAETRLRAAPARGEAPRASRPPVRTPRSDREAEREVIGARTDRSMREFEAESRRRKNRREGPRPFANTPETAAARAKRAQDAKWIAEQWSKRSTRQERAQSGRQPENLSTRSAQARRDQAAAELAEMIVNRVAQGNDAMRDALWRQANTPEGQRQAAGLRDKLQQRGRGATQQAKRDGIDDFLEWLFGATAAPR